MQFSKIGLKSIQYAIYALYLMQFWLFLVSFIRDVKFLNFWRLYYLPHFVTWQPGHTYQCQNCEWLFWLIQSIQFIHLKHAIGWTSAEACQRNHWKQNTPAVINPTVPCTIFSMNPNHHYLHKYFKIEKGPQKEKSVIIIILVGDW